MVPWGFLSQPHRRGAYRLHRLSAQAASRALAPVTHRLGASSLP